MRLLKKEKKPQLSVLVPPGPAPRLVPGDSPNATRPRPIRAPVPRQTPAGTTRSGIIDYIAAFADPPDGSPTDRLDHILEPQERAAEDSPD